MKIVDAPLIAFVVCTFIGGCASTDTLDVDKVIPSCRNDRQCERIARNLCDGDYQVLTIQLHTDDTYSWTIRCGV